MKQSTRDTDLNEEERQDLNAEMLQGKLITSRTDVPHVDSIQLEHKQQTQQINHHWVEKEAD
jgi:hypothetical protein